MSDVEVFEFDEWSTHGFYRGRRPPMFVGPATHVVLHHSVTEPDADGQADVQEVDDVTSDPGRGFSMFPYSAASPPEGGVYLGRDDEFRNGANHPNRSDSPYPKASNVNTLSFCLVMNGEVDEMTEEQMDAALAAHRRWVERGSLLPDATFIRHSDLSKTACPGKHNAADIDVLNFLLTNDPMPGGPDMPYLIAPHPGQPQWEEVLPGKGSTLVDSPNHWAGVNVTCAKTGKFESPYLGALLDDQRHVDEADEIAGAIEPFVSELEANMRTAIAGINLDGVAVPTADAIAEQVIAKIKGKL